MMSESMRSFEKLATQAAQEPPESIDVVDRVMESLRLSHPRHYTVEPESVLVGAGSLVLASAALVLVRFGMVDNSLFSLLQPFFTVCP